MVLDPKIARRRAACLQTAFECIPAPDESALADLRSSVQDARRKAVESGSPDDELDYILAASRYEDALSDHYRLQIEQAVSERRRGGVPTKDPTTHARDAVAEVAAATGDPQPWENGEEVLQDDALQRLIDVRMLMDNHTLGDAEQCVILMAELVDGMPQIRTGGEAQPSAEQLRQGDDFRADEYDIVPPVRQ